MVSLDLALQDHLKRRISKNNLILDNYNKLD